MFDYKLVIVYGKGDLVISELSLFWYVKIEEGIIEFRFHCLEFEDVGSATSNQDKVTKVVLSSVKSTRETLEKGTPPGWGQIVDVA